MFDQFFNAKSAKAQRTQGFFIRVLGLLCVLCVLCGGIFPVFAQDSVELKLSVTRLFGYGGGDQIQGKFRMELVEPPVLKSVTFYADDIEVSTVTESPYRIDFNTDDYPPGWHDLKAVGTTPDGATLNSNVRRFEFVTAAQGWEEAQKIVVPLFSVVGGIILLMVVIQVLPSLLGKKKTLPLGAERNYGIKGGAICPKCHRPFSIHFTAINLPFAYFDRCDHCGQWSLVKPASREQLAAAERAELEMAKPDAPIVEETKEEKLARQIDDSRYTDEI